MDGHGVASDFSGNCFATTVNEKQFMYNAKMSWNGRQS